jgi:hypothetical protein
MKGEVLTIVQPMSCKRCGKHCKEKSFTCSDCMIEFSCNTTLVRHITTCSVRKQNKVKRQTESYYESIIKQLQDENDILKANSLPKLREEYEKK